MAKATLRKAGPASGATVDVPAETVPGGDDFDQQVGVAGGAEQSPESGTSTAVANYKPVERYADISDGGLTGEFDETDLRHPVMRLVNGSGKLSASWPQGTLLLGDEVVLPAPDLKVPNPKHTFRFVPLNIEKGYRENLSDEEVKDGKIARVAKSIAEVESLGGTTQWIGDTKPDWSPTARCLLLIERPEECEHPNFAIPFGDKLYAVVVYYSSNSAYRHFAQVILNTSVTSLLVPARDGKGEILRTPKGFPVQKIYLPKKFWTWRTLKRPGKGTFSSFTPEIRLHKEDTGDEIRQWITNLLQTDTPSGAAPSSE